MIIGLLAVYDNVEHTNYVFRCPGSIGLLLCVCVLNDWTPRVPASKNPAKSIKQG
jgi:hypothetical protein